MANKLSLEQVFAAPNRAKHIIQVNLVHRKGAANVLGGLHFWKKSGSFGSMDNLMKVCPAMGCKGLFYAEFAFTDAEQEVVELKSISEFDDWPVTAKRRYLTWEAQVVTCPLCGLLEKRGELPDTYGFNTTVDKIASTLEYFFEVLDRDADMYLVRTHQDNAFQKAKRLLGESFGSAEQYGTDLEKARKRDQVFYSRAHIYDDLAGGAASAVRFKALLTA